MPKKNNNNKKLGEERLKKHLTQNVNYTFLQVQNIWVMISNTNNPNQKDPNIQLPLLTIHLLHIYTGVNNMNLCFTKSPSRRQMLSTQKITELWTPLFFLFLPSSDIPSHHEMFLRWHWPNCNGKSPEHHHNTTTWPVFFFKFADLCRACSASVQIKPWHHLRSISVLYWAWVWYYF